MSETPDTTPAKKRAGGLSSMLIADLKSMAVGMGISGASTMKKAQLVDAIKSAQASRAASVEPRQQSETPEQGPPAAESPVVVQRQRRGKQAQNTRVPEAGAAQPEAAQAERAQTEEAQTEAAQTEAAQPEGTQAGQQNQRQKSQGRQAKGQQKQDQPKQDQRQDQRQGQGNRDQQAKGQQNQSKQDRQQDAASADQNKQDQNKQDQNKQDNKQDRQDRQDRQQNQRDQQQGAQGHEDDGDEDGGSRRSRRRRGRERTPTSRASGRNEPDTTILEDDVLVPAAGILDVLENYAFVRTSGYLPGTDDVYLSLSMVKKYGLRRGDAVVGQVRQPREGERREKFNPMVRIDQVNGTEPDSSRERQEFETATPVHPAERLRLETTRDGIVGRVVDVAAPLGKGQRTLVLAPAKSGKTVLLQEVAQAITANNPECHLMVVLVDERPEEVTDFQRSIKGEVVASTFDRPAADHVLVAELAVERAKRLVELGHDVVILLDSLTRLTRAYNQTVASSGRDLPGGLEPAAVHAAKRVFGAGRNIEDGGSLTVVATLSADSGSVLDEAICEELLGTATSELRLDRELAAAARYPAVDVRRSGTRREDVLLGEQEAGILHALRHRLATADVAEASKVVLDGLAKSRTNIEFLTEQQRGRS